MRDSGKARKRAGQSGLVDMSDGGHLMDGCMPVWVDSSLFPQASQLRLEEALVNRRIPAGMLYMTHHQAMRWLAVHERWSPSRKARVMDEVYRPAFRDLGARVGEMAYWLFSLGCGGGHKEQLFFEQADRLPEETLVIDISTILAVSSALRLQSFSSVRPVVADLDVMGARPSWLEAAPGARRVVFFLGMLPNMDPDRAWNLLSSWTDPGDLVVLSANMASGAELSNGLPGIVPQYDNPETRLWIQAFGENIGVFSRDGDLGYRVFTVLPGHLSAIGVDLTMRRDVPVALPGGGTVVWREGESICLFQSLRYSDEAIQSRAGNAGFNILSSHLSGCGEEGTYVLQRAGS